MGIRLIKNNYNLSHSSISTSNLENLRDYISSLNESKAVERSLQTGMAIIDQAAYYLNLDDKIKLQSVEIFDELCRRKLTRGRSIYHIVLASIYSVCRLNLLPITISDIALVTKTPRKDIARTFRLILNKAKITLPPLQPSVFIERYSKEVEATSITKDLALLMLELAKERRLITGRDPSIVAAALIYTASLYTKNGITQNELADRALATPVSIRNYYKNFLNNVNHEIIRDLHEALMIKEVSSLEETKKVWNKYLVTFLLNRKKIRHDGILHFSSFNSIFSDMSSYDAYLEKTNVIEEKDENIGISLTLWVNVSAVSSFVVPQNINFKINEIFGSEAVLNVHTKFLEAIPDEQAKVPAFVQSSQLWEELNGDATEITDIGFNVSSFQPPTCEEKGSLLTSDFFSVLNQYKMSSGIFDSDLLIEEISNYDHNQRSLIKEKIREGYYSENKELISFSVSIVRTICTLDIDDIWRRNVTNDLFQIMDENKDENITSDILTTLKTLQYEKTYNYEEIISLLNLGYLESQVLISLKNEGGDLYQISIKNNISEFIARKTTNWLLQEGLIERTWEGLSMKYISISKQELLEMLQSEYQDEIIPLI